MQHISEVYKAAAKFEFARYLVALPDALNLGAQLRDDNLKFIDKSHLAGDAEFSRHIWWEISFAVAVTVIFSRTSAASWRLRVTLATTAVSLIIRNALTLVGTSAVWQRITAAPVVLIHVAVWYDALIVAHVIWFRDQRLFEVAQQTLSITKGSEDRLDKISETILSLANKQEEMLKYQDQANQLARAELFAQAPQPQPPTTRRVTQKHLKL